MGPILTRCGYRCDLCLAYKPNIERNPENKQKLSDGWYKYFGFRIPAEKIICDGCMEDQPTLIDQSCPVRPCVIEKKLKNCTECDLYICEKLRERIVVYEDLKRGFGMDIPDDDYKCFIQPYENKHRLDIYRATGEITT
ncbi:MAG: hypothetical protein A2Y88_12565 [Chloroflexi bacterium RBG_13_48_10]|nr:MAG: hypothetical protein A2Y88_12565 [Chloroflexi bacterium RBG_13_48_10]